MNKKLLSYLFAISCVFTTLQPIYGAEPQNFLGPRNNKRPISPWITKKNNLSVYRFNVFNLDPENVSNRRLREIFRANTKDIERSFGKDYGVAIDVKIYSADRLSDPKLFKGDRIPFFIVNESNVNGLGFHSVQADAEANEQSYLFGGSNIFDTLGIVVPNNFPAWTPYAATDSSIIREAAQYNLDVNNPYGIQDFFQLLSFTISHEFKDLITDDSIQNWTLFDTFAPTVANWHFAEVDDDGVVVNGTIGPDGFLHLPLFLDVFPAGGLFNTIQENADPVSFGSSSQLQAYKVRGWSMSNYTTSNFWKGYNESDKIKWDKKGFVETPLQPFAGLHEILYFLSFDIGLTFAAEVVNWGPLTPVQRGDTPLNNFPPNYTIIFFKSIVGLPIAKNKGNLEVRNILSQMKALKK